MTLVEHPIFFSRDSDLTSSNVRTNIATSLLNIATSFVKTQDVAMLSRDVAMLEQFVIKLSIKSLSSQ